MKHERLVKSSSRKLGAILTVSSLLMVNLLSPVAVLAQGSPDIHMEEGDFVHDPEDIVLPELPDLGKLEEFRMPEIEHGHFELSDIQVPNPTNQMEVEVGTFEELQRVIDEAVQNTALVINITDHFEFNSRIMIRGGLDITLQSEGDYILTQRNGRHFIVQPNSLLTLKQGITLDGASQAGGIDVSNAMFTMEGAHITNNKANNNVGGGIYAHNSILNLTGGTIQGNSAQYGGGLLMLDGEANMTGVRIAYNESDTFGGGMFAHLTTVDMTDVAIEHNAAVTLGGGMYLVGGTVDMVDGLIDYNEADNGGGMFLSEVTANITRCIFMYNSARKGGGMYIRSGITNVSNIVEARRNSADFGGGIFLTEGATANVQYLALNGNKARTAGGGVYIYHAKLTIRSGLNFDNSAEAGGGIYVNNGDVVMENGLIINNEAFQGGGVVVGDHATFTLRDGYIGNNRADIDCNVSVYPTGTFNQEGGSVSVGC